MKDKKEIEKKNKENGNIEKKNRENRNAEKKDRETRNVEKKNKETRNIEKKDKETRNIEKKDKESGNIEKKNKENRNIEKKAIKTPEKGRESKNTNKKQETTQTKEKQKRDWKEYIYNCPFLLVITLTSLVVMVRSDEIGIRAAGRQAQSFASESYAEMPEKQEVLSDELIRDNTSTDDMKNLGVDGSTADGNDVQLKQPTADIDPTGHTGENSMDESENAGECKEGSDDLQNDNELREDDGDSEDAVNTEGNPKGITRFEYYDPVPTESRYYKDAGKVAMTTEYPYTKENIGYFDDAAFLGDSRTLGISDYAGLEDADFYCDSGMMIFKLLEEGITYQKTGNKVYMKDVLQEKQYGKIYIMLGMNELGYGDTELYLDKYRQVLQQIREWQPEAIIYVMANLHVSKEKNNMETEFNNLNINAKNAASASLANGTDVFYLDVNPVFTDEEGYLKAELTFDGVHLYAQHYDAWREFLLEHAVESEGAGMAADSDENGSE